MKFKQTLLSLAVGLALSSTVVNAAAPAEHVLLISVDGLHQNDLDWYVRANPNSTLAKMVQNGTSYNNARTPFPSDSFPGMVGQTTGGNPKTTGVYYDDAYNRGLLPMGTSTADCVAKAVAPGAEVFYAEVIEPQTSAGNFMLDAGQGIAGLYPIAPALDLTSVLVPGDITSVPANILTLVSSPDAVRSTLIDPATLPVDPNTCTPVYPHQYLQVNTIFEVARASGLRTAWTDKHPAYEILNGPSGYGIDDFFAPEINSVMTNSDLTISGANDWTKDNTNTQQYDTIKVRSVINEIKGYDHAGVTKTGTPAIFGMNFQAVSVAQKLTKSSTPESVTTQLGGYLQNGTPGPVLVSALNFINNSLGQMQTAINANAATQSNTVVILSAKHGQSSQDKSKLIVINDGTMIDALNAAWRAATPSDTLDLVAHAMDDDTVLLWLNNRSAAATAFAKDFLSNYTTGNVDHGFTVPAGIGSDFAGNKVSNKAFKSAGLSSIYAGSAAASLMGVNYSTDQRVPDVIGFATEGSVYGGGKLSKLAEHGGNSVADRSVPIVVSGANIGHGTVATHVDTIQIAPTILALLGLNPQDLQAVKIEGTKILPGLPK